MKQTPLKRSGSLARGNGPKRETFGTRICKQCGEEFVLTSRSAAWRDQSYCSRECGWQAQKERARASWPPREEVQALLEDQHLSDTDLADRYGRSLWWAQNMRRGYGLPAQRPSVRPKLGEMIKCAECGEDFYAKASQLSRDRKYCSRKCLFARVRIPPETRLRMNEEMSEARRGPKNPAWKGGFEDDRPLKSKFSLKVKGETACRNCGTGGLLHMHHVLPRSFYKAGRDEILNGVPLCPACHAGWHHRVLVIHRDIFTEEEWAYLTSVKLTGQEIMPWLDKRYPERPAMEEAA